MVINSIKITNFRCYYGTSSLSFNADGKITLIWGDSGFGKSSLLQFFRWMFYNDYDFGKNDDKPLYNIASYKEKQVGEHLEVSGQIDFTHLGVSYRLNKSVIYNVAFKMQNATVLKTDCKLQIMGADGGYHPYEGDILNIINTILPKELSQYFLLDGERSRDIVLNSSELRKAIHSLFGLDAYTEALSHIGVSKNQKTTVLGHYASLVASNSTQTINGMSIADMQETIQELYEEIETQKEERRNVMATIEQKNARRDEILKILGAVASKNNLESLIKIKQQLIKNNEQTILSLQHNIGTLFYKTYPYLFLAQTTSQSSAILRKKNLEYASSYQNVFENLKKDLLKEIIKKDMCVCGRALDDASRDRINAIIDIMPPGSYVYEFGQFISKAKNRIKDAESETMRYESYTSRIAQLQEENSKLEDEIQEKLDELKRLNDAKDLVVELEQIKAEIQTLNIVKAGYEGRIAQKKQIYEKSNKLLSEALRSAKVSAFYKDRLEFFENLAKMLAAEKDAKENLVRVTLNKCVRDIFKKLTTQTELDADKIQFINDDFSLRTTYLTGGQLAVDVYSYVIGIIKALQECQMENNENPIIVDAPFAFTGNIQSEHIFKTFPTVSKQTILLTLDLNKIRKLLPNTELYDFYIIKNDTQEKATIVRGDVNAIKF